MEVKAHTGKREMPKIYRNNAMVSYALKWKNKKEESYEELEERMFKKGKQEVAEKRKKFKITAILIPDCCGVTTELKQWKVKKLIDIHNDIIEEELTWDDFTRKRDTYSNVMKTKIQDGLFSGKYPKNAIFIIKHINLIHDDIDVRVIDAIKRKRTSMLKIKNELMKQGCYYKQYDPEWVWRISVSNIKLSDEDFTDAMTYYYWITNDDLEMIIEIGRAHV